MGERLSGGAGLSAVRPRKARRTVLAAPLLGNIGENRVNLYLGVFRVIQVAQLVRVARTYACVAANIYGE